MSATSDRARPAFEIRPEQERDARAIAILVEAAFRDPAVAHLVAAIRSSREYLPELALVAEDGSRAILGFVMVSTARLSHLGLERPVAVLSPLAVDPANERRGIGSSLVREATARTKAAGWPFVVLEGSPTFYGRLGFVPAAPHGIEMDLPSWASPEAAQVWLCTEDPGEMAGRLVLPPAFDLLTEGENESNDPESTNP